jgi:hypothetical protein
MKPNSKERCASFFRKIRREYERDSNMGTKSGLWTDGHYMGTLRSDSFMDRAFLHALLEHGEIAWVENRLCHALLFYSVIVPPIHYSLIILPFYNIVLAVDSVVE